MFPDSNRERRWKAVFHEPNQRDLNYLSLGNGIETKTRLWWYIISCTYIRIGTQRFRKQQHARHLYVDCYWVQIRRMFCSEVVSWSWEFLVYSGWDRLNDSGREGNGSVALFSHVPSVNNKAMNIMITAAKVSLGNPCGTQGRVLRYWLYTLERVLRWVVAL